LPFPANPFSRKWSTKYLAFRPFFDKIDFVAPFGKNRNIQFHSVSTHDRKHGRIEDRDYAVSDELGWLIERHPDRKTIRSIGVVELSREVKGQATVERRHFISSLPVDAEAFAGGCGDIGA
jgi:hypothetical protein